MILARGQEIQVDGEETRITYPVVENEGGGGKFKCDGCDKVCERSNLLRHTGREVRKAETAHLRGLRKHDRTCVWPYCFLQAPPRHIMSC